MKKLSVIPMCVAMLAMVSCGGNSNEKGNSKAAKTKTKKDFSDETYVFEDGYKFKKYTTDDSEASSGTADKLIVLQPKDDAATSALGKGWRMPVRPVK